MPTMNQEKADELKYKIESLFEEYANFGDIKFKVSINYFSVVKYSSKPFLKASQ